MRQSFDSDFWEGDLVDDSLEFEQWSGDIHLLTAKQKAHIKELIDAWEIEDYRNEAIIGKHAERNPKLIIKD